jgi:hypothetical protein
MLSLFIGALANMLSSRRKHHSKPPRYYRISRLVNSVRAPLGVDLPTPSFVLHWQNQVRLYENQVEKEKYFWNGQKRHMLQNAVHPVQELPAVKTQADQHKTQTGKELTYDQYVNLLLSATSAYNAQQFAPPKTHFAARSPHGAVYSHDITESSDDNHPACNIACALDTVQPKTTHIAARTPRPVVYSHDIK